MKSLATLALALTLACSALGCQSHAGCGGYPPPGMMLDEVAIWHVVLVRLNHPDSDADRAAIVKAARSFRQIPGVVYAGAGSMLPTDRPNQQTDFDIGVTIGFRNAAALNAYVTHPVHLKAVDDVLKPLAKSFTARDFLNEEWGRAVPAW